MLRSLAAVFLSLCTAGANAAPPFPLGIYVGNANGSDPAAMASFKAGFDAHKVAMNGARPGFFGAFTDFSRDPSTWASSASWAAWSSAKSGTAYLGPDSGIVPIVGVPLAAPGLDWGNVEQFYLYTIAGAYDGVWAGIVDGWADHGYKTVDFRIAYEMNGNFMSWSPAVSNAPAATARADFVHAFRRVADVIRAQAAKRGVKVSIHWNPAALAYATYNTTVLYPGDAYVDVISIDQYSPMYPLGLTDWSTGGNTQMTDPNAWAAIPANRAYYFRYPNSTMYLKTPGLTNWGWSLPQSIAFAKLHGKPIAVDETGTGRAGSGIGPIDDPEFPRTLATLLHEARAQGVGVRNVTIWDAKVHDGDWQFSSGSKPQAAAAWKKHFGDVSVLPTLTIGQGLSSPSTVVVLSGGLQLGGWSAASRNVPIAARIGRNVYAVIAAANGRLTLATPAPASDVVWGGRITPG